MKGKKKSLISFAVFMISFATVWYFTTQYHRSQDIEIDRLKNILEQQIEPRLQRSVTLDIPAELQAAAKETFKNEKSYLINFESTGVIDQANDVHLKIVLGSQKQQLITQNSSYLAYHTPSNEVSEDEWRELRRIINFLGKNLLESQEDNSGSESFTDHLLIFDVYFYKLQGQQTYDLTTPKKQISASIVHFLKQLGLSHERARINFWNIEHGEYDILDESIIQNTLVPLNRLKQLADEMPNALRAREQNRIYYDKYRECSLLFFVGGANLHFEDQNSEQRDFVAIDNLYFAILQDYESNKVISDMLAYLLHEFFHLQSLYQLRDTLQHVEIDLNQAFVQSYFQKRESLLHYTRLKKQITTLKFLSTSDSLIFTKQNQKQISDWADQTEQLILHEKNFLLQRPIMQNQDNLNELDEVGIVFSFSDEYTMGVYLPLMIPLLWPFLLTAFKNLKEKRRSKEKTSA